MIISIFNKIGYLIGIILSLLPVLIVILSIYFKLKKNKKKEVKNTSTFINDKDHNRNFSKAPIREYEKKETSEYIVEDKIKNNVNDKKYKDSKNEYNISKKSQEEKSILYEDEDKGYESSLDFSRDELVDMIIYKEIFDKPKSIR